MTSPVPAPFTAATLRPAEAGDLPGVKELLRTLSLPWDGLTDFFPGGYVVATSDGALVGVAGLETYGTHGFLRSVAVLQAARGHGLGAALVRDRMAGGRAAGLQAIHLLTADAAGFFSRIGFAAVDRSTFPAAIRASVLASHACQPEHVAAMSHSLVEEPGSTSSASPAGEPARRRASGIGSALLVLGLLLASVPAGSAPGDLTRVRAQASTGTHAFELADHLANRIGPRLTGSERLARACDWAKAELESYGLTDVRLEDAGTMAVGFERGPSSGRIVAPAAEAMALELGTPAWSAGTPGRVRGPARHAPAVAGERAPAAGQTFAGAFVLLPAPLLSDPPAYAALMAQLTRDRAAGVLIASPAEWIPAVGNPVPSGDALPTLPVIFLAASHWQRVDQGVTAGRDMTLEFDLQQRFLPGPRALHNVVGEIPGRELPEEVIVIGAHLDSWDAGTGATDNAVGCATTLAAARILQSAEIAPRRTIRFVLFTGEEQGLIGSTAYTRRYAASLGLHSAVLIQDRGAGPIIGIEAPPALARELEEAFAPLASSDASDAFTIRSISASDAVPSAKSRSACSPSSTGSCAPGPSAGSPADCGAGSGGKAGCAGSACCAGSSGCAASPGVAKAGTCPTSTLCPSDHWPFLGAGVPAFLWLQAEPVGGAERHHTSLDVFAGVERDAVERSAQRVAMAALALADHERALPRAEIQPAATP